jgi:uncharacterized protein YkwD
MKLVSHDTYGRLARRGGLLGLAVALFIAPFGASVAGAEPALKRLEDEMYAAVNAERQRRDLAPLARLRDLDGLARSHSVDMAKNGFLKHDSSDGRKLQDRIEAGATPGYTRAAENLGRSTRSDPNHAIVQKWLASDVHRRNMLAPHFNTTGVGIARAPDGAVVYTQLFASYPDE